MATRRRTRRATRRARNQTWRLPLFAALALVGLCATLEGGARLLNPQLPEWQGDGVGAVIMSGHPTRLWYMRPGIKQNHQTTASINELGIRGPLPTLPRPQDRQRIVVVGDSSFFGFGVSDNETFHTVLTQRLLGFASLACSSRKREFPFGGP